MKVGLFDQLSAGALKKESFLNPALLNRAAL